MVDFAKGEWTEKHTVHFTRSEELRKGVEADGARMGTPGELAIFVSEAASLLEVDNLGEAIGKLEQLTGRSL